MDYVADVAIARQFSHTSDTPEYQNPVYAEAVSTPPVPIVSPRGRLVALAVVCALFAAMGVVILLLAPTETLNLIVGVAAIAFFGVGGGISLVTQWRRSRIIVADDEGVHITGVGTAPWADVERFGSDSTHLGLRLRRSSALLDGSPGEHTAESLRATRARTGWDLTWPATALDRSPAEAAAALQARRPR